MPEKSQPTAADFLQRVVHYIGLLSRMEELKKEDPDLAEKFLAEKLSEDWDHDASGGEKAYVGVLLNYWRALEEERREAADAGRELAKNMNATDSPPVFRLVERVEHESGSAALNIALCKEQPRIEAACARRREEPAPAEDAPVAQGSAVQSQTERASAAVNPVISIKNSPNARVKMGNLSATAAGRDLNQQEPTVVVSWIIKAFKWVLKWLRGG